MPTAIDAYTRFFENLPVETLIDRGLSARELNRHRFGRAFDELHAKGCEKVFALLAAKTCSAEKVSQQMQSIDSTTFSLTGEYRNEPNGELQSIEVCHGYSKDQRLDLK